jgi:hypothetical protein
LQLCISTNTKDKKTHHVTKLLMTEEEFQYQLKAPTQQTYFKYNKACQMALQFD